jgi:hypothetical protein
MTNYKKAKQLLVVTAKDSKNHYKNDKPAIRQIINDTCYFLTKDFNLSDKKADMLHNFACTLHPKK